MSELRARIKRLEDECHFRRWFQFERYMESLSEEQLSFFARHGFCEDPQPEPLLFGSSKLDTLDRKKLVELWQESERTHAQFATRSSEDQECFCIHGHWPEEVCGPECSATPEERV